MLVDKGVVSVDHETPAGATMLNVVARGGDSEADVDRVFARRPELDRGNKVRLSQGEGQTLPPSPPPPPTPHAPSCRPHSLVGGRTA